MFSLRNLSSNVIGIDFGTEYLRVGTPAGDSIALIPTDEGEENHHCYITFTDNRRLFGQESFLHRFSYPKTTIFDFKRALFKNHERDRSTKYVHWPFKFRLRENLLQYEVSYLENKTFLTPTEMCAMIFSYVGELTRSYIQNKIYGVIISVPSCFSSYERKSIQDAAKIAGLPVMEVVNDTTALAISYSFLNIILDPRYFVFIDAGAGTFEVAVVRIEGHNVKIISQQCDELVGGRAFDKRILKYAIKILVSRYGKNIVDMKHILLLNEKCKQAKENLSTSTESFIKIEDFVNGITFEFTLSRRKFVEICSSLFQKVIFTITEALENSGIPKSEIARVSVHGSSSRLYELRRLLTNVFGVEKITFADENNQSVVYGTTILAASRVQSDNKSFDKFTLKTLKNHSLNALICGETHHRIVERYSSLPTEVHKIICVDVSPNSKFSFGIYEGDNHDILLNKFLGKINFYLQSNVHTKRFLRLTFNIDHQEICVISGKDMESGKKLQIHFRRTGYTMDEIQTRRKEVDSLMIFDKERNPAKARQVLVSYVQYVKEILNSHTVSILIPQPEYEAIENKCNKILNFIYTNTTASVPLIELKLRNLKDYFIPISVRLNRTC